MAERFVPPAGSSPALVDIGRVLDLNTPATSFPVDLTSIVSVPAGEFRRLSPRASGMTCILDAPTSVNFAKSVALYVSNSLGSLRIQAQNGLINGAATLTVAAGTTRIVRLWSDGVTGWATTYPGLVANSALAPMPANTLKGNATSATATPQDIAVGANQVVARSGGDILPFTVAASRVVGRGAAGNLTAMSPTTLTDDMVLAASDTQQGKIEIATAAECNALTDTTLAVTPGRIPLSSTTQSGLLETATSAELIAESTGNLAVVASIAKHLPGMLKAWCQNSGTTVNQAYNVTSVSNGSTGLFTVTFTDSFSGSTNRTQLGATVNSADTSNLAVGARARASGTQNWAVTIANLATLANPTSLCTMYAGELA